MQGKAKIGHHPIHPAMAQLPVGCFVAAALGDVVSIWYDRGLFATVDTWLIGFGILSGLGAAGFGLADFLTTPLTQKAREVAAAHVALNACAVLVYGAALAERAGKPASPLGYALTGVGLVLILASSWLGGELVFRHLAGVFERDTALYREPYEEEYARSRPGRLERTHRF